MKEKQNMTEMFKGYSDYSDEEYKNIWKNAIIVVDSNILLNFYRYSEDTRNKIFKILEKLKSRLWIPYQVGKEFFNNKNKVMVNSYNEYDTLMASLQKKLQEAKEENNKRKNNQLKCKTEINNILDKSIKNIEELLNKEKIIKKPEFGKNTIENKILSLFNNSIGEQIVDEEYEEMRKEGLRRFKELVPPGYKDSDKDENGDYYIFYSFIKKAKEENKDVIFITDDVKEDWFNEINGEKHGGRYELLNEFYKETNQLLIIYTSDGFAEAYNKNLDKGFADENTINELKTIRDIRAREYYNNSLIDRKWGERLSRYRKEVNDLESLEEKEELLNKLRFIIRRMDIPFSDKEDLLIDLRRIRGYTYHGIDSENTRLKKFMDKLISRYNENYGTMGSEITNSFKEKCYDSILALKKYSTLVGQRRTYIKLKEYIKDHLEYLSRYQDEESYLLSKKLEKILSNIIEDMSENSFKNKDNIIEELEFIFEENKNLIAN